MLQLKGLKNKKVVIGIIVSSMVLLGIGIVVLSQSSKPKTSIVLTQTTTTTLNDESSQTTTTTVSLEESTLVTETTTQASVVETTTAKVAVMPSVPSKQNTVTPPKVEQAKQQTLVVSQPQTQHKPETKQTQPTKPRSLTPSGDVYLLETGEPLKIWGSVYKIKSKWHKVFLSEKEIEDYSATLPYEALASGIKGWSDGFDQYNRKIWYIK